VRHADEIITSYRSYCSTAEHLKRFCCATTCTGGLDLDQMRVIRGEREPLAMVSLYSSNQANGLPYIKMLLKERQNVDHTVSNTNNSCLAMM